MLATFKSFVGNESGATAIEYALIASLIAIALVTILGSLGTRLSQEFSEISSALKEAQRRSGAVRSEVKERRPLRQRRGRFRIWRVQGACRR